VRDNTKSPNQIAYLKLSDPHGLFAYEDDIHEQKTLHRACRPTYLYKWETVFTLRNFTLNITGREKHSFHLTTESYFFLCQCIFHQDILHNTVGSTQNVTWT